MDNGYQPIQDSLSKIDVKAIIRKFPHIMSVVQKTSDAPAVICVGMVITIALPTFLQCGMGLDYRAAIGVAPMPVESPSFAGSLSSQRLTGIVKQRIVKGMSSGAPLVFVTGGSR